MAAHSQWYAPHPPLSYALWRPPRHWLFVHACTRYLTCCLVMHALWKRLAMATEAFTHLQKEQHIPLGLPQC